MGLEEKPEEFEKKAHAAVVNLLETEFKKKQDARMPFVIIPDTPYELDITDKEGNGVYRLIVFKAQAEDVIKALRKRGTTSRIFSYDKANWEKESQQKGILKEQVQNLTTTLMRTAMTSFQQIFIALMHLKVVRAYVDGVLRFGIPPKFYIGVIIPKKGAEKQVLLELTEVLAEASMKEMYGEKLDSSEADDYWPFVCVNLTSPLFLHNH